MHALLRGCFCLCYSLKEEVFWRNYFYRVSLIKQSAQLTALAAQQQAVAKEGKNSGANADLPLTGTFGAGYITLGNTRNKFKIFF